MYRVAKPRDSARRAAAAEPLGTVGRYAGPATLILSSLADGPKHGYALTKDIEEFAGVRLAPGTLYEALSRLDGQGLIEALESSDRRRPAPAGGAFVPGPGRPEGRAPNWGPGFSPGSGGGPSGGGFPGVVGGGV